MMKRLLLAIAFCLIGVPAFAATCSNVSPQLKDNAGTTFNAPYVDDGTTSGDCQPKVAQGLAGAAAAAWYEQIIQGGSALSATNGLYGNILQGNAVLSATNGIYDNLLQGNAVLSLTNPIFSSITDGTTKASVKAASTAAVAADPAFVVAVSPNNTIPIKVASGQVAAGAIASGAVAAGAISAGAYVSGSVLSGAFASGALVDVTNLSTPISPNTATATKGLLLGMQYNSTQATFTNGQQGTLQGTSRGAIYVATGADAFAVNATLQASATTAIGKVDPNTIATWGLAALGGATAPTNAIATACEYLSSAPTYTTGQTGAIQCTAAGSVHVTVDNTNANIEWNADGVAATTNGAPTSSLGLLYNGSTVDRARSGSVTGSALATPVPTSTAGQALSHVSGASASITSLVAKASAGNLYGYNCTAVAGAAAGFCVAYNGTTAPSTGALTAANVLDFCYFGTTAAGCSLSRIPMGVNYSTGIVILVTSAATPYTYTTGTDTAAITADYQ